MKLLSTSLLVFRYHKPKGVLSTTLPTNDGVDIMQSCAKLRHTINEATGGRFVVPIGRLDKDSSGLLLLTTEESLCARLLRPSVQDDGSPIEKEYHVRTSRRVSDTHCAKLSGGMKVSIRKEKVTTRPCVVERLELGGDAGGPDSSALLRFVLREGKNRQIRKMLGALGHAVKDLKRVRFGTVELGGLAPGGVEALRSEEVKKLLKLSEQASERAVAGPAQEAVRRVAAAAAAHDRDHDGRRLL